jgi:hypothetical protein
MDEWQEKAKALKVRAFNRLTDNEKTYFCCKLKQDCHGECEQEHICRAVKLRFKRMLDAEEKIMEAQDIIAYHPPFSIEANPHI